MRAAIESMYEGVCSVTEMQSVKNPTTGIIKQTPIVVLTDQPCRLSHRSAETTTVANGVAVQNRTIKLFVSPDVEIKPGSKITITQNGLTADYKRSGLPAVYESHQEINLVIFDTYA